MTILPCMLTVVTSYNSVKDLRVKFYDNVSYKTYNTKELNPILHKGMRLYKLEKIVYKRGGA
jgi:hypothetical protein